MPDDFLNPGTDPFRPPAIPTEVGCIHCGEEYDSYRIEWRVFTLDDGRQHGFWCCPMPGCDGKGFGFDILPTDPDYQDENGGWIHDEEDEGDEEEWDGDDTDFGYDEPVPPASESNETGGDDTNIPY